MNNGVNPQDIQVAIQEKEKANELLHKQASASSILLSKYPHTALDDPTHITKWRKPS
jgi:hypothetical protein